MVEGSPFRPTFGSWVGSVIPHDASSVLMKNQLWLGRELGARSAFCIQELGTRVFPAVYRPGRPPAILAPRRAHLLCFAVEVLRIPPILRFAFPDPQRDGLEYRLFETVDTGDALNRAGTVPGIPTKHLSHQADEPVSETGSPACSLPGPPGRRWSGSCWWLVTAGSPCW